MLYPLPFVFSLFSSGPIASTPPAPLLLTSTGSLQAQEASDTVGELRAIVAALDEATAPGDVAVRRDLLRRAVRVLGQAGAASAEELGYLRQLDDAPEAEGDLELQLLMRERICEILSATLPEEHEDRIVALASLGTARLSMGDLEGARDDLEVALEAFDRYLPEDHPSRIGTLHGYASVVGLLGDPEASLELNREALELAERTQPEGSHQLAIARQNYGSELRGQGRLDEARPLLEQALEDFRNAFPEDSHYVLATKANLGTLLAELRELDAAAILLEEAVEGYARIRPPGHPQLLVAQLNLAVLRSMLGDPAGARALDERVIAGLEQLYPAYHPDLLLAQLNYTETLRLLGDYEAARAIGEKVLAGYELHHADDDLELQRARLSLGTTLSSIDTERAIEMITGVVTVYERKLEGDHPDLEHARLNLAVAKNRSGDLGGAIEILEQIREVQERTLQSQHPETMLTTMNLAANLSDVGELERARALIEVALGLFETALTPDHEYTLKARSILARTMTDQGDLEGARELLDAQVEGMTRRVMNGFGLSPREARAAAANEDYRVDCALFLAAPEGLQPALATMIETRRNLAVHGVPFGLLEDPESVQLQAEIRAARAAVQGLAMAGPGQDESIEAWRREFTDAAQARDDLLRKLRSRLSEYGLVQATEAPELCSALSAGDLAISYLRYDRWHLSEETPPRVSTGHDAFLALVYSPDGTVRRVELGPADAITELVRSWRTAIGQGFGRGGARLPAEPGGDALAWGRKLRRALVDPVLADAVLANHGRMPDALYVCLDDVLHAVPLAALPLDEDGVVLGDVTKLRNELSFARLVQPDAPARDRIGSGLLAIGGLDYGAAADADRVPQLSAAQSVPWKEMTAGSARGTLGAWVELPGTRVEVEAVCDLFRSGLGQPPLRIVGQAATKEALFEAVRGKRFVHVATHGWFAGGSLSTRGAGRGRAEPRGSGTEEAVTGFAPLALSGLCLSGANEGPDPTGRVRGLLTAEELSSFDFSACELAVLSACDTNVGVWASGQGLLSLRAALHRAGARASITSLWRVGDAATRELMTLFYEGLWERGQSKADALWSAQETLRRRGEPYSAWAAWVLTGDPN